MDTRSVPTFSVSEKVVDAACSNFCGVERGPEDSYWYFLLLKDRAMTDKIWQYTGQPNPSYLSSGPRRFLSVHSFSLDVFYERRRYLCFGLSEVWVIFPADQLLQFARHSNIIILNHYLDDCPSKALCRITLASARCLCRAGPTSSRRPQ